MAAFNKGSAVAIDTNVAGIQGISNPTTVLGTARIALGYDYPVDSLYSGGNRIVGANATSFISIPITGTNEVTYGVARPMNTSYVPRLHF